MIHSDIILFLLCTPHSTVNACFWTAFGIGVMDKVIIIPNGLGAALGAIQMFLCLVAPRREILASGDTEVQDSHDLVEIDDVEEAGGEATGIEATETEANDVETTKRNNA